VRVFRAVGVAGLLSAAVLAGVVGCGGDGEEASAGADVTLELAEQESSGQEGTATFTSLGGGRTRIVLELTNPTDIPQPAHVHDGSCDDLGDPVVALNDVRDGRSETEAEMSLERLQQGDLVIHAHKSDAEFDVSVACAPVVRAD
jgi:hypothetical protein